jgi:hypothetical protein
MIETVEQYCSSKLYVWFDDFDPIRVTELLGIEPDEAWHKNDRKVVTTLAGKKTMLEAVHRRGCWYRSIRPNMRHLEVEAQIEYWCQLLMAHMSALDELQAAGCEVIIDCYISSGPVIYIDLSPEFLQQLVKLKVRLTFGIYDTTSREFQTVPTS